MSGAPSTCPSTAQATDVSATLLDRLGGDAALAACVSIFYVKNLADPRIARFFEGVDLKRLERHQNMFLRHVFTDSLGRYTGATMEKVHARLIRDKGLNQTHFDCVAENLVASLAELQVSQSLIDEVVSLVVPLRPLFPAPPQEATAAEEPTPIAIDATPAAQPTAVVESGPCAEGADAESASVAVSLPAAQAAQAAEATGATAKPAASAADRPNGTESTSDPSACSSATEKPSLLQRLGGEDALAACIKIFYDKNLTDPRIARFFEGVDVQRLARHQTMFMRHVFTGTLSKYTGASIQAAHARLIAEKGLNNTHFDCVAENLVASLTELNVPQPLIDEVVGLVLPLRPLFPEETPMLKDPTPGDTPTLLERLGGDDALKACVAVFYNKNLADERIARFFEGVDIKRLERHQNMFLRHVFTNSLTKYTGATMQAAHARLIADKGLNATHFDCVAENLVSSMQHLNVPEALIDEVVELVVPLRSLFPEPTSSGV